jgi:pilus assembly protein CpaE
MSNETLTVSVLNAGADFSSQLEAVLTGLPRLRILSQTIQAEELFRQNHETQPDLIIVNLVNGSLPAWLTDLGQKLPQTAVMVCSPNRDPDFLIQVIQMGIREFMPLPFSRPEMEAALERVRVWSAKKRHSRVPEAGSRGRVLAITGLKGGMGATAVAVNLAVSLAGKSPERVALVDLGRPFPDVAKFLDQTQQSGIFDLNGHGEHLDADFVQKTLCPHPSGLAVLQGCANFLQWQLLDPRVLEKVWAILRSKFDWIVVDLGHWLDDLYLKTVQTADQVLLLTDLQIPNVKNLKALWEILQNEGLTTEKVQIVVNRYHKKKGDDLALEGLERVQGRSVFCTLPDDHQALSEAINHGVPLQELAPRSKLCRGLGQLAEQLASACHSESMDHELPKARRRFLFF